MTLGVRFGAGIDPTIRRRIAYAAQMYAATYGCGWADDGADVTLGYGATDASIALTPAYNAGVRHPQELVEAGDWLGALFVWLGGESEALTDQSDSIGLVPYEATTPGRFDLDPLIPWASRAMASLDTSIRKGAPDWPMPDVPSVIVATHDLDFLPLGWRTTLQRRLKNAAIALLAQRSPRLALSITVRPGVIPQVERVVDRERRVGITSSAYVIAGHGHRRDANYSIEDPHVVTLLHDLSALGCEIGVHGSYDSVLGRGSLASEYQAIRSLGFEATGGRQHWLRYRPSSLFSALEAANALYDASVGFNDRPGYRAGATFAYIPWDFTREAPHRIIELPMVIMDATLFEQYHFDFPTASDTAMRILDDVSRYPGGAASIVWHNTAFGGMQLPVEIGELYWELKRTDVPWVSGAQAATAARDRFRSVGLLD